MRMHHLHKVQEILSRSSTQTEEEVEDMVQAKDEVAVVATKIKANKINNQMTYKQQILVEEDSLEAGGEFIEHFKEIM